MSRLPLKNSSLLRTSALALSSLLLVAGCAGSPSADMSSPGPDSGPAPATATPTPTPTYKPASADGPAENVPVPEMPAIAKEHTEEGLKAFIEYYYDLIDYSYESQSTDLLSQYTNPLCGTCSQIVYDIQTDHAAGAWRVGGETNLDLVYVDMSERPMGYKYGQVKFNQKSFINHDSKTDRSANDANWGIKWQMFFKAAANGWIVVDMGSSK